MKSIQTARSLLIRLAESIMLVSVLACRLSWAQSAEPIRGMIGIGTWNTQAEFRDIRVVKGAQRLYQSDFTKGLSGFRPAGGTWEAVGGSLRQTGSATPAMAYVGDPSWSDYTLTLTLDADDPDGKHLSWTLPDVPLALPNIPSARPNGERE
jgi:hypothetical protein